jgi:hypothetical protein
VFGTQRGWATPWSEEAEVFGHQTLRDNVALLDDPLFHAINARIAAAGREVIEKRWRAARDALSRTTSHSGMLAGYSPQFDQRTAALYALPQPPKLMLNSDLKSPRLLWFKGILFLLLGCVAATLLWLELSTLKTAALLALCVWAFCRAYYFAFYVIERYADPGFRFSGLLSVLRYLLEKSKRD